MAERVLVIGGGLAGLAAAQALGKHGRPVRLIEARQRWGGRAGSFVDPATHQIIDACQHVSMGCCTNLAHFFRTFGIAHLVAPQPALHFMTPDRRVSMFRSDAVPAPLHLARAFHGLHFLSLVEKARIAFGLMALKAESPEYDPPLVPWLMSHGQTPITIARFWGLVLVSALNEAPERLGLKYARKVFVDGFMAHRRGFEVEVPVVPLARLYGEEMHAWFAEHDVELQSGIGVKSLAIERGRAVGVVLRDGATILADEIVLAVPWQRVAELIPADVAIPAEVAAASGLKASPITSVHVWYDRPVLELPHVVLVDCLGQWVFNRGRIAAGEYYVQVVVSAAHELRGGAVAERIIGELGELFPLARQAVVLRSRVISEPAATFSARPGVDRHRPGPRTSIPGLTLAGDWTATGWPATMEGAVRSGYAAAEVIVGGALVQPDLA